MLADLQAGDVVPASYMLKLGNGITIGGWVVDESDAPIAGAKLEFNPSWRGWEDLNQRGEQSDFASTSTISDEKGRWQMKGVPADLLDPIGIRVSHPDYIVTNYFGHWSASMDHELRAGTFKVVLCRGFCIAGRVLDEAGNPIGGATVTAGKPSLPDTQQTRTDERGAFRFRNLSLGEVQFSVLAKGRKPEVRKVEIKPGMPEILFRLGPGQVVRGIVKAETGEPLAGVRVALGS